MSDGGTLPFGGFASQTCDLGEINDALDEMLNGNLTH